MLNRVILENFRGRRVLVTGGTGLVGRCVVDRLVDAGAEVRVASLDELRPNSGATYEYGDLTDPGVCRTLTDGMDDVFHIAGIKGSVEVTTNRPASFFVPLLQMNTNLLDAARAAGIQRLVYTSSIGAYPSRRLFHEDDAWEGDPMDTYPGWAKRMGELQIRACAAEYGLSGWSVVRLTNVYGPGDNFDARSAMVIPALMQRIRSGENPLVVWGDGSAVREFAYSEDVADGIIRALHHGTGGEVVNLGTGIGTSVRELVETLAQVVDFRFEFDPSKPAGFPERVMDIEKARTTLGYEPRVNLAEGLRRTWQWFCENSDEHRRKMDYFRECA